MRYLYGDSVPFPHAFNFLQTLEAFMVAATRIVVLESESRGRQMVTAKAAADRVRALEELETFHEAVMRAIQDAAARNTTMRAATYATQIAEHASRIVEEEKRTVHTTNDRDQAGVRGEVERSRAEIRAALEVFFVVAKLPVLEWNVTLRLQESGYLGTADVVNPDGIASSFGLGVAKVAGWQGVRRVGDFVQGLSLMVGLKKGFFSRTVQREALHVDDYVLSGLEIAERACTLRLRKKATERDALVFEMHREEGELRAEVTHPQEEGSEAMATPVEIGDLPQLGRLWDALRISADGLLEHKERLLTLRLEGEDVFENDLAIMLLERMIRFFAPTVHEIAKRSPSPEELSLKIEHDTGRREEIYVKKSELVGKVAALGDKERALFGPLGLLAGEITTDEINFDEFDA